MDRSEHFFHGTSHEINGLVLPGVAAGHHNFDMENTGGHTSKELAFASSNEQVAWDFADSSNRMAHNGKERSRVYEVHPHPEMTPGLYHSAHPDHARKAYGQDLAEYVAPHYRVKSRIDIKPGHQGTLPLNWNQFSTRPGQDYTDVVNHPTNEDIEKGHEGSRLRAWHDRVRLGLDVPGNPNPQLRGQLRMPSPHDLAAEERARLNPAGFSW